MIIACIELSPAEGKRQEILEILRFVQEGVRRNPACRGCGIYECHGSEHTILYLEQWQSESDLGCHIRSRAYLRILNAIDLAREKPDVHFYSVTDTRQMELVETLRAV
jgi:quinol monooxygenase YgiN